MAPKKREREGDGQVSRLHYEQADDNVSQEQPGYFSRASAAAMAGRQVRQVTGFRDGGGGGGLGSKNWRRKNYFEEMQNLNKEFAQWANEQTDLLRSEIRARGPGETRQGPPYFCMGAPNEYIRRATEIRAKYMPVVGDVLSCGTGEMGQLGWPEDNLNAAMTFYRPQPIKSLREMKIVKIACGAQHNIGLTEDGKVLTWGCNDEGPLGQMDFTKNPLQKIDTAWSPAFVTGFFPADCPEGMEFTDRPDEFIIDIAAGDCHSLALSNTGNVYFWGCVRDRDGKHFRDLPTPEDPRIHREDDLRSFEDKEENKPAPQPPKGEHFWPIHVHRLPGPVKEIHCHQSSSIALMESGELYSWGLGEGGEMGRAVPLARHEDGSYDLRAIRDIFLNPAPMKFGGPEVHRRHILKIGTGLMHTLVLTMDYDDESPNGRRSVYSCGMNNYGQLGNGEVNGKLESERNEDDTADDKSKPVKVYDTLERVKALDGKDIDKIAGGEFHSIAVDVTGTHIYTWGRGESGELGICKDAPCNYYLEACPVKLFLVDGQENPVITRVACGTRSCMVLTEDGEVWTWGFGENGALGHGRPQKPKIDTSQMTEDEKKDVECQHISTDETRPKKLDVMYGIRKMLQKDGNTTTTPKGKVLMMDGGAQHSLFLISTEQAF